jgi:cytochrome c biogenesis protein CcmG/thiol:disulfide interchange protein DsbE
VAASQSISNSNAATSRSSYTWRFAPHRSGLIGVFVAAVLLANGVHPAFAATLLLHKEAPRFVRTDLEHKRLDLNSYRGKVVLLNFWATWCAPCKVEIPRFVEWQKKYGPRGLQIIGISMDDDPHLVHKAYGELGLNYPVVMGDEKLGELYGGILGLPVTFLIDRHGKIRSIHRGETDINKIEMQLQSLFAADAVHLSDAPGGRRGH